MDENDCDAASPCLRSTGFVLLPGFLPTELVKVLEAEAIDLLSDARSGKVQSVRIYDDFPKIFWWLEHQRCRAPTSLPVGAQPLAADKYAL